MATSKPSYFNVTYRDPQDSSVISLKANSIGDSSLGLSFVKISDFIFDTSSLVVNPAEEQLQKRFENILSLHLSIYSIMSIEEVGNENRGLKFAEDKSNLVVFPNNSPTPPS